MGRCGVYEGVLLQVGPCGEVCAYIMALWGGRDLSPTCGDPHKE